MRVTGGCVGLLHNRSLFSIQYKNGNLHEGHEEKIGWSEQASKYYRKCRKLTGLDFKSGETKLISQLCFRIRTSNQNQKVWIWGKWKRKTIFCMNSYRMRSPGVTQLQCLVPASTTHRKKGLYSVLLSDLLGVHHLQWTPWDDRVFVNKDM